MTTPKIPKAVRMRPDGRWEARLHYTAPDGLSATVDALVEPPKLEREEAEPYVPSQVRALLSELRGHRLDGIVTMAVATGLRQGELLGLRWQDVDLAEGTVRVVK